MAIEKVEMYTVVCDNCGHDIGADDEYSCWNDKGYAEDNAMQSEWYREGEKHYCPDCFDIDDEDNLIILPNSKV
jgi:hypothetical protein